LKKGLAPATVTSTMTSSLGQVLGDAVRDGRLLRFPVRWTSKAWCVRTRTEMAFLTPDEIARVADAIEPPYSALVWTAAYTGLRAGELHGLRVEHLDLLHGSIQVEQMLTEDAKGYLVAGPTNGLDATMSDSGVAWMWHERPNEPSANAAEAPEGASDQDVCLERTTGLEPATLTLAR
jgi:hypothetical protein